MVKVTEGGIGGMETVSHEASTYHKTRSDPELLRCAFSGAKYKQS
jgi:hypothetical protein